MDIQNTIPQIIHQIQEENDTSQLSVYLSTLYDTWILKHPLWQYKHWSLQDVKTLIQDNFPDLLKHNVNDEFLLKVARYFILCNEGGVFVDSDFECIKPFDNLIENAAFSLFTDPHDINSQMLSDSIIISKKEHPFLKFIISHLKENLEHCIEIAGNTFINEMFCKYNAKDEILILPFGMGNPCTRDEIKIYEYKLLSKEYIQKRVSEAYAICYYKKEKKNRWKVMPKRLTDVLYISTAVGCVGGAFNAGYRIHTGLRKVGLRSKMLVLNSGMTANKNILDEVHIASREKDETCGYDYNMLPLHAYTQYLIF